MSNIIDLYWTKCPNSISMISKIEYSYQFIKLMRINGCNFRLVKLLICIKIFGA